MKMTIGEIGLVSIIVDGEVRQKVWTERNGEDHYVKVKGHEERVSQKEFEPIAREQYPGQNVKLRYR